MTYVYNPSFNVTAYVEARVAGASAFREGVVQKYRESYKDFWLLERSEVSVENLQAILDNMGPGLYFPILTDAATFVEAITTAFPDDLEEKYHSAPYEYTITQEGRLVIGELKKVWQPEPEEEIIEE